MTFKKGQSGNPAGRRKGSSKVSEYRALLEPHADKLVQKAVDLALSGDTVALRLCVDRLIPALKATEHPVKMTRLKGTLTEQGNQVLAAVTAGKLTPSEGTSMLAALSSIARITELDELIMRIETLEEKV